MSADCRNGESFTRVMNAVYTHIVLMVEMVTFSLLAEMDGVLT